MDGVAWWATVQKGHKVWGMTDLRALQHFHFESSNQIILTSTFITASSPTLSLLFSSFHVRILVISLGTF